MTRLPRPATIASFLLIVFLLAPPLAAEGKLSKEADRLVKQTLRMGRKRRVVKSEEWKFAKLLAAVPPGDLAAVLERLNEEDDPTDRLRELIARVDAVRLDAEYPGARTVEGFIEDRHSKDPAVRERLLRRLLTIEDLTAARKFALETADWKERAAQHAAADVLSRLVVLGEKDPALPAKLRELVDESVHPSVRCVAASGLEEIGAMDIVDRYVAGLDEVATDEAPDPDGGDDPKTYCFGSRAWYRLAVFSGHDNEMEYDEYRALSKEDRATRRKELADWWKKARRDFSFLRTSWEIFSTDAIVRSRVVALDRPQDAAFTFRAPSDRAFVKLVLAEIDFIETTEKWRPLATWKMTYGIGGKRSAYSDLRGRRVRVGKRAGGAQKGIAWIDVAVQRIGSDRVRVVVRYADFVEDR